MQQPLPETQSPELATPIDTALPGVLKLLPQRLQPFALLARWDRPVGFWLLWLPCVMGLFLNRIPTGLYITDFLWVIAFLLGAIAMRGAGCTWNDIRDRDIDAQVSRTAARPLPAGAVSLKEAYAFLAAQIVAAFPIWLALPRTAKYIAVAGAVIAVVYPVLKRITWWPQLGLGLTFGIGAPVGASVSGVISGPVLLLYFACVLWIVAYDTIYALQDRDDDALIGVRSTARLFGKHAVLISFCFHLAAAILIAIACAMIGAGRMGAVIALVFLFHGVWQASRLKSSRNRDALLVFKSNVTAGLLVAIGLAISAMLPERQEESLFATQELVPDDTEEDVDLPFGLKLQKPPQNDD